MISFLRSNACRIAPTSRSAGKNPGQGTPIGNRDFFGHIILPVSSRPVLSRSHCRESCRLRRGHCFDQGTTQVKTVASPRGEISHGPDRRREQQCLTEVEPDAFAAVLDI